MTEPWSTILVGFLSPIVVVAGITAIQNWRARRAEHPKVAAEADAIGRRADGETIDRLLTVQASQNDANNRLEARNKELSTRLDESDKRVDHLEDTVREMRIERSEWLRVLQLHSAWDLMALADLRRLDQESHVPDPPPLTPPTIPRPNRPTA